MQECFNGRQERKGWTETWGKDMNRNIMIERITLNRIWNIRRRTKALGMQYIAQRNNDGSYSMLLDIWTLGD